MKTKNLALLTALILAISSIVAADGTVEEVSFFSPTLGSDRAALVYLPEGYEDSASSYPVIYLIGSWGAGGPGSWLSLNPGYHIEQLDQMVGEGLIDPVILVEVDPKATPWAPHLPVRVTAFMTDSELNGNHETAMVEDLVPFIDASYRTLADRDHRYLCGASAGGYSATRLALRHWDLFGGLLTQVGAIAMEPHMAAVPLVLAEYPDGPPYDFYPTAGEWSMFMFGWCAAMTPNLTNPPWYVDLWIDQDGQIIPEVAGRYLSQSNSRWAAEMAAAGGELEIFMSAGDEDFYLPFTTYFANDLDSLGIPYTLHMFHGKHDTNLFKPHLTFFIPLNATVEIQPDTLNCRSNGRWVTAYIELPGDLSVGEIDLSTLTITGVNGSDLDTPIQQEGPTSVSDVNGNGVPDLMVKFDRGDLVDGIGGLTSWSEPSVTVTIEGNLINGWFLEAEDSVQLVCNRRRPAGAD